MLARLMLGLATFLYGASLFVTWILASPERWPEVPFLWWVHIGLIAIAFTGFWEMGRLRKAGPARPRPFWKLVPAWAIPVLLIGVVAGASAWGQAVFDLGTMPDGSAVHSKNTYVENGKYYETLNRTYTHEVSAEEYREFQRTLQSFFARTWIVFAGAMMVFWNHLGRRRRELERRTKGPAPPADDPPTGADSLSLGRSPLHSLPVPPPDAEAPLNYIVGIDLGGTNIAVGCVSEDGTKVRGLVSEPTRSDLGPDGVVARMVETANRSIALLKKEEPAAKVVGVGIGAPGPLDFHKGVVLLAPNLGWKDMPLRSRISEGLKLPAALDNDANCAALGEWWQGAAKGTDHALAVTIGTGIGGGVILHGKIYHGASDCAGELGHTTIDMDGRRCACGNYGCLEAYTSGPAIALRAAEAIQSGCESSLRTLVAGDLTKITAQTVYDAAAEGDELALEVVRDTASYLGAGIANFLNIFNPEVVVVCGGVTAAGERLFGPMQREVARRAFKPAVAACRIVPGTLPGSAGVLGAAKAFLDQRADGLVA